MSDTSHHELHPFQTGCKASAYQEPQVFVQEGPFGRARGHVSLEELPYVPRSYGALRVLLVRNDQ